MPTGDALGFPSSAHRGAAAFEPSAALAILDGLASPNRPSETASARDAAWEAAWIACLTNSPRWAEAARREFATATGRASAIDG